MAPAHLQPSLFFHTFCGKTKKIPSFFLTAGSCCVSFMTVAVLVSRLNVRVSVEMSEMRKNPSSAPPIRKSRGAARSAQPAAVRVFTVLHVDDDPNDTELLRAATRRADAHLDLQNVEDGEQAIAYLNGFGPYADRVFYPLPALILLDLKMPRATGFELLKWIRKHPEIGAVPVVILSGSELHEDIRQAYAFGANSYLIKPPDADTLREMLNRVNSYWLALNQPPDCLAKYAWESSD